MKIFLIIFFTYLAHPALARDNTIDKSLPSLENIFGKWKVLTVEIEDKKVCYCMSRPVDSTGNHSPYDRSSYLIVSKFSKSKKEVSVSSGYNYRKNSTISVSIDGYQVKFQAEEGDVAWVNDRNDLEVIQKMLNGFKVMVFGESLLGTYTIDTYSLEGFKLAYEKVNELCEN
jgi:hypothetical protein